MWCFLLALFRNTVEIVRGLGSSKREQISSFRVYMSRNQSMSGPGSERIRFYEDVVHDVAKVRYRILIIFVLFDPFVF